MILFQRRQQAMVSAATPSFLLEDFNTLPESGKIVGPPWDLRGTSAGPLTITSQFKEYKLHDYLSP